VPSVLFHVVESTYNPLTVTAEVASSSLVVPAIPNQALTPVEEFSRGHKKVQIPREASNSAHGSPTTMFTFNACLTPAAAFCASRLRVEASKSYITATSSKEAEFDTSTTLVICRLLEYLAW
jgi:hypothetical protein